MAQKTVAVLMGGTSSEREVSLETGRNVANALASLGMYNVVPVVLSGDCLDELPAGVDACYIALHGGWGESGGVQEALDARGIAYTGPGVQASRVALDKVATKRLLDENGIPTATPWAVVRAADTICPIPYPCVIKPPLDGSTVGISKVSHGGEWMGALELALRSDAGMRRKLGLGEEAEALVEAFIPGREMTVGIVGEEVLPVIEICAPGGWYGYTEKYQSNETQYVFPEDDFLPEMQRLALEAYKALGCRGVSRIDFRITPEGKMGVLEANTSPGMTSHSLVPKAAAKAGLSFAALCDRILSLATHD